MNIVVTSVIGNHNHSATFAIYKCIAVAVVCSDVHKTLHSYQYNFWKAEKPINIWEVNM